MSYMKCAVSLTKHYCFVQGVLSSSWASWQILLSDQRAVTPAGNEAEIGRMWDHNGTYMSGLGSMYQKHQIVAEVGEDDNLAGEHHPH